MTYIYNMFHAKFTNAYMRGREMRLLEIFNYIGGMNYEK